MSAVRRERQPSSANGPHIRPAASADLSRIAALWVETGLVQNEADARADVRRKLAIADGLLLVAEVAGGIAGTALGAFDGRRGWIYRTAVARPWRRAAVGRALVVEVERRLAAAGATRISLLVEAENAGAGAFWSALGYEPRPNVRYFTKHVPPA